MADSFWQGTTDGTTQVFTVPFPYIEQSDVVVKLNGISFYVTTDYQWTGPSSIRLQRIPNSGNTLEISRSTSPDGPLVSFQNGAILTGADLNTAVLQAFYRTQELQDQLNTYINAGVAQYSVSGSNPAADPQELLDAAAAAALSTDLAQTLLNAASDISTNAESILTNTNQIATLQSAIDALASVDGTGIATYLTNETTARISGDTALAETLALLGAVNGGDTAFIVNTATTYVDGTTSMADLFSGLQSSITGNTSAITSEATTRAAADSALSTLISGLTSTVGSNTAAIATEATTRASADSATATTIASLTTTVAGHTTSISTQATSIAGLEATYTVRIDSDGNVAGFGLASGSGGTSEFTVLANKFSIIDPGAPGGSPTVPFTVTGGVVYMQNVVIGGALIEDLTVGTGKLEANSVTSISTNVSATEVVVPETPAFTLHELDIISITVTTDGGQVEVDAGCTVNIGGATGGGASTCNLQVYRDGSPVTNGMAFDPTFGGAQTVNSSQPLLSQVALVVLDAPAAGSHTYTMHAQFLRSTTNGISMSCYNNFIKVMEIKK